MLTEMAATTIEEVIDRFCVNDLNMSQVDAFISELDRVTYMVNMEAQSFGRRKRGGEIAVRNQTACNMERLNLENKISRALHESLDERDPQKAQRRVEQMKENVFSRIREDETNRSIPDKVL